MSKRSKRHNNKRSNVKKQIARARKGSQIVRASKHTNESLNLNRKNLILLAVSVVLAITVTFAASYAWFNELYSAKADIEMPVYKFDFSAKANGEILVNDGANTQKIVLSTKMLPGKTCLIPLQFINGEGTSTVQYSFEVVSMTSPMNAVWKFGNTQDLSAAQGYDTLVGNAFLTNIEIPENTTHTYYLYCDWVAIDTPEANAADQAFQAAYDEISLEIQINAHQTANDVVEILKIQAEDIADADNDTCNIKTDAPNAEGGKYLGDTQHRKIYLTAPFDISSISFTYSTYMRTGSFNIYNVDDTGNYNDNIPTLYGYANFINTGDWLFNNAQTTYSTKLSIKQGERFCIIPSTFVNIDYITLYS